MSSLVAEVRFSHPDLVLTPTIEAVPGATIRPEFQPRSVGEETLFLRVRAAEFEAFEEALAADPTVEDPVPFDDGGDERLYRVRITSPLHELAPSLAGMGIRVIGAESHDGGWRVRLQLPDREALRELRSRCHDRGIAFGVQRLYAAGTLPSRWEELTDKQRETLRLAYEEGYFDVPRRISQGELAERLGISDSAISQRLRRGLGILVAGALEGG